MNKQIVNYLMVFKMHTYKNKGFQAIGLMGRVFANGSGNASLVFSQVITKTQKMVLDSTLFNTRHYKLFIKGKIEQSKEWSNTLTYTLVK